MIRFAAYLALVAAALLGRALFDAAPPAPTPNLVAGAPGACDQPTDTLADRVLYVNGLIRIPVCTPGVLRVTLTGSAALGRGAHAQVTVGSDVRWDAEVLEPRPLTVAVDAPGWIAIAFLNDRREGPEDRNLWISDLAFEAF